MLSRRLTAFGPNQNGLFEHVLNRGHVIDFKLVLESIWCCNFKKLITLPIIVGWLYNNNIMEKYLKKTTLLY